MRNVRFWIWLLSLGTSVFCQMSHSSILWDLMWPGNVNELIKYKHIFVGDFVYFRHGKGTVKHIDSINNIYVVEVPLNDGKVETYRVHLQDLSCNDFLGEPENSIHIGDEVYTQTGQVTVTGINPQKQTYVVLGLPSIHDFEQKDLEQKDLYVPHGTLYDIAVGDRVIPSDFEFSYGTVVGINFETRTFLVRDDRPNLPNFHSLKSYTWGDLADQNRSLNGFCVNDQVSPRSLPGKGRIVGLNHFIERYVVESEGRYYRLKYKELF